MEEQQGSSEFGKYEFVLVISGDDRLIQRMNELGTKDQSARTSGGREDGDKPQNDRLEMTFGNMETCVTKGKSSDAKWRLDSKDVVDVLSAFTK